MYKSIVKMMTCYCRFDKKKTKYDEKLQNVPIYESNGAGNETIKMKAKSGALPGVFRSWVEGSFIFREQGELEINLTVRDKTLTGIKNNNLTHN